MMSGLECIMYWFGYGLWTLLAAGMFGGFGYEISGPIGSVFGVGVALWLAWRFR